MHQNLCIFECYQKSIYIGPETKVQIVMGLLRTYNIKYSKEITETLFFDSDSDSDSDFWFLWSIRISVFVCYQSLFILDPKQRTRSLWELLITYNIKERNNRDSIFLFRCSFLNSFWSSRISIYLYVSKSIYIRPETKDEIIMGTF